MCMFYVCSCRYAHVGRDRHTKAYVHTNGYTCMNMSTVTGEDWIYKVKFQNLDTKHVCVVVSYYGIWKFYPLWENPSIYIMKFWVQRGMKSDYLGISLFPLTPVYRSLPNLEEHFRVVGSQMSLVCMVGGSSCSRWGRGRGGNRGITVHLCFDSGWGAVCGMRTGLWEKRSLCVM